MPLQFPPIWETPLQLSTFEKCHCNSVYIPQMPLHPLTQHIPDNIPHIFSGIYICTWDPLDSGWRGPSQVKEKHEFIFQIKLGSLLCEDKICEEAGFYGDGGQISWNTETEAEVTLYNVKTYDQRHTVDL